MANVDIATMVQEDIEARAQLGEKKYGGRLEVGSRNNMRSPLMNEASNVLDQVWTVVREAVDEKIENVLDSGSSA